MAYAPGLGPGIQPEQEWALEVTRRLAYNGKREEIAEVMRKLHHDNMILRAALVELLYEN